MPFLQVIALQKFGTWFTVRTMTRQIIYFCNEEHFNWFIRDHKPELVEEITK
jgi:hypothetical protein